MSILIKGMEMPSGNNAVSIIIFPNGKVSLTHDKRFAEYAEAVSVPPHGRLIEAEKLGLSDFDIVRCEGDFKEGLKMLIKKIDEAPTIIPASKEGE